MANETPELLPCPFCGDTAVMQRIGPSGNKWWEAMCGGCGISGPDDSSEFAALTAWNTRTPTPASPPKAEHNGREVHTPDNEGPVEDEIIGARGYKAESTVDNGNHNFVVSNEGMGITGPCAECGFSLREGDHTVDTKLDSHLLGSTDGAPETIWVWHGNYDYWWCDGCYHNDEAEAKHNHDDAEPYIPKALHQSALAERDARIAELEAALKPFADCCGQIDESEDGEEWAKFRLLIKNYRAARQALTQETPDDTA